MTGLSCPWCKSEFVDLEQVSGPELEKPQAGDAIFCGHCGRLGLRLGRKEMRRPTHNEVREHFMANPLLVMALLAWRRANGNNRR